MNNLFIQRLKYAKRELTALKTAYVRGLGMMKVYEQTATAPSAGHESGFWTLIINVGLDTSFTAYPFVQLIPQVSSSFEYSIEYESMQYENSGYSASFRTSWRYQAGTGSDVTVFSTSPITSISFNWSKD